MAFPAIIAFLAILFANSCIALETYKPNIDPNDFSWVKSSYPEAEMQNMDDLKATLDEIAPIDGVIWEDTQRTFCEMVQARGYPAEQHTVTTEDGYILVMHRIPYGRDGPSENRPVAFVQHGLLASSTDWILSGVNKGLAYMLADRGYDVWLGNARGNYYSKNHTTLDPKKDASRFWDFSWHEIGYYDIPAMIDYALEHTKQDKLFHIGHSQGTTSFYVMTSSRPEYNDKIRAHFSLSPVVFMGHLFSPMLRMSALVDTALSTFTNLVGMHEFLPNSQFLAGFAGKFCDDEAITQFLCRNALFVLCGFSRDQMNSTLLPILVAHTPAGAATKQLLHYGQLINSNRYRRFDLGLIKNRRQYGSFSPPNYNLGKVTAPVYFFYSRNDWMSAEVDVLKLERLLPNVRGKFLNPDPKWNHLDFTYGIDADRYIYNQVISLMTRH